jgi:hypothetical protein
MTTKTTQSQTEIKIDGDRLSVHFDRFDLQQYKLFLQVKRLPEYSLQFHDQDDTYTISAPARFAPMLGIDHDHPPLDGSAYIYALIDPFTNQVRYIGKSIRPRERLQNHCNDRSHCHRTHWIQSLITRGLRPIMLLLDKVPTGQEWQPSECNWITYAREQKWPLTNSTDGGDGIVNLTAESKERIVNTWRGRKHLPESLLKIGAASRNRTHNDEWKRRMSERMRGRTITPDHRRNLAASIRKLTDHQVLEIRRLVASGESMKSLAPKFNVSVYTIRNATHGRYCYGEVA